jgi:hypothetical protein
MPDSTATATRRDELLAIAARLFAEKGFKNTTVRDIADAAGHDQVLGAGHDALRGEVHRLLRGAALTIDGHPGHVVGQSGHQPRRTRDVAGLRADRVAAAEDHVLDGTRVDAGTPDQRTQRVRGEVGGVNGRQRSPALAYRGADRIDDECFRHGRSRLGGW